jgi:hypothetical protein
MALAACGGGDDDEDANELLNKAFNNSIGSATVALDTELTIEGVEQLNDPIQVKLNGPYKSNGDNKVPSFDFDISGSLGGQSGAFKFTSTGDNAFVGFQGTNYEIGEEQIAQANEQAGGGDGNRSLADLGLEPRNWVKDAKTEGDEDVAGTETTRVSGTFDVAAFLRDLNEVASSEEFAGQAPAQLSDEQIEQFTNAVKNPRFDIYVGKDDDKLHRLSTDLEFEVPEAQRAQLGGASGGKLSFSVELSDIGKEVTVAAPENVRPISDLTEQLGGLGSLGGLGGGSTDGGGSGQAPGGATPGQPGTTPGAEAFEAYSECLEKADPSDTDAIQECAELLR